MINPTRKNVPTHSRIASTMHAGIHSGASTPHHGHAITPHNLSVINTIASNPQKLPPLLLLLLLLLLILETPVKGVRGGLAPPV
jgi:hypothetical protein